MRFGTTRKGLRVRERCQCLLRRQQNWIVVLDTPRRGSTAQTPVLWYLCNGARGPRARCSVTEQRTRAANGAPLPGPCSGTGARYPSTVLWYRSTVLWYLSTVLWYLSTLLWHRSIPSTVLGYRAPCSGTRAPCSGTAALREHRLLLGYRAPVLSPFRPLFKTPPLPPAATRSSGARRDGRSNA